MTAIYDVLKQDFASAKEAFANTDFHNMNICANRLMSNVVFGHESDRKYMVVGFFLRIIANDFLARKDEGDAKTIRQHAEQFVAAIERAFKEEVELTTIWNGFFDYTEKKREILMTAAERKVYRDNRLFTAQAFAYLAERFFNDPFLKSQDGVLLTAFLVEADRVIRNHGANNKELVLFCLMRALDWTDRYIVVAVFDAEKTGNSSNPIKESIKPYLERIQKWYSGSEEVPYREATGVLCDILIMWRELYLRYLERSKASLEEERRMELPGQVRQRIGETIAQALQKDIAKKEQNRTRR
jgi:hypothetical protein